jgi:hypothetical protein
LRASSKDPKPPSTPAPLTGHHQAMTEKPIARLRIRIEMSDIAHGRLVTFISRRGEDH